MLKNTKLVLYEGPRSLKDAGEEDLKSTSEDQRDFALMHCTDTQITVNGHDCYVYDTNVNHARKWVDNYMPPISRTPITYFDFEGEVRVQITVPGRELKAVKISPVSYGIEAQIDKVNSTVTFMIERPDNYTVTFNDSPERAVHIFANPIETESYSPEDENVVYIGPGEWDMETIMLKDGQTLYLAGGAVVHGVVNADFAKNVTVKGRGIIDGSHLSGWKGKTYHIPLKFDHCENIKIEDIIVLNANAWVCQGFDSKNGVIDGVRIISARPNGDGITLQSCKNYEIKNCFIRTWDDSLVVKNYDGNSDHITFTHMQLWTDFAQSMEIGYETNKGSRENASISNIVFEDITVLNNFHKPVISVHNADDAAVSDIIFRNIVVEYNLVGSGDADEIPYLIDINITQNSNWSTTKERGTISDVTIENVNVLAGYAPKSRIKGFDEDHKVRNVTIKNLEIKGKKIKDFESGQFEIDTDTTTELGIIFL
ncbi:MAG: hypothetical protein HDR04_04745 [Lachnospiraceae bacterium]|nr:hypothetical protein [Lachnospiraceae bacterium]